MSNFPFPWWDKTVTIYNRDVDVTTQKISWYRTVVTNCFWKEDNTLFSMGRYGVSQIGVLTDSKRIVCRIPQDERYVSKREWENLTDKTGVFTLNAGDIIVLGEVEDVIDEYTEGERSTDLLLKYRAYDECLEIETYTDNVRTGIDLAHYKVLGE